MLLLMYDPVMRQGREWAIEKSDVPPVIKRSGNDIYPQHDRAVVTYNHYISGFTEEEILEFLRATGEECELADIVRDIQHIKTLHPTRVLIAHENDRNRLLIQRTEGRQYRRLLAEALAMKAEAFVAAGMSPTTPLKEFREAVGMTEKPGAINVSVNQQNLNLSGGERNNSGVRSSEDLLRSVMDRMKANQAQISQEAASTVIDAEVVAPENTDENKEELWDRDDDIDIIPDPDD